MPWLALGYPLLAHLAVQLHSVRLQWLALVWLLLVAIGGALRAGRLWAWIGLFAGAAALYVLVNYGNGMYALYIPPVLIPLATLLLFASSLRSNAVPLVTRMATLMRGEPLPPVLVRYTRHVTQLWCGVCVLMIISAVTSAIWATPALWSLLTNVIHYLVLGAVFVLEFFYRRAKYRHLESWGLFEYLRRLARTRLGS